MADFTMTPLCGFGMGEGGGGSAPVAVQRTKQTVTPTEGGIVQIDTQNHDGMLIMTPATALTALTIGLPTTGDDLQMIGITSMKDIANIVFIGGAVLNAPMELLENQAVLIQRVDPATNKWITLS